MTGRGTTSGAASRPRVPVVLLCLPLLLPWALAVGSASAATKGTTLQLSPSSGGPGTRVTVLGSGFCSRAACQAASVSVAGRQLRNDIRPPTDGPFTATVTLPGGLISGEVIVSARQVLDDGNELVAEASFTYAPSKGEAAERDAETRDLLTHLVNPTAPAPAPKGRPVAGAPTAAPPEQVPATTATSAPAAASTRSSPTALPASPRWWLVTLVAGGAGLAFAGVARAARRHHRATSTPLNEESS